MISTNGTWCLSENFVMKKRTYISLCSGNNTKDMITCPGILSLFCQYREEVFTETQTSELNTYLYCRQRGH